MRPGIAWVKGIGKVARCRMFTEFREIRHRKHPRLEIEIKIGERRFKVLPQDIRRWQTPSTDS